MQAECLNHIVGATTGVYQFKELLTELGHVRLSVFARLELLGFEP